MKTFEDFGIMIRENAGVQTKADCPSCGYKQSVSVNTEKGIWNCKHAGCEFKGTLAEKSTHLFKSTPLPRASVEISDKAVEWFASRGISKKTLDVEEIGTDVVYFPQLQRKTEAIRFPYKLAGNILNVKSRDYEKNMRFEGNGAPLLFWRIDDIRPGETIIITEGEIDALVCIECGMSNVLSVPNGATKSKNPELKYMEAEACPIEWPDNVILAADDDVPGTMLRNELARRIGIERCSFVEYPEGCKDFGDVILKHGKDAVREVIDNAHAAPVHGIQSPSAFFDQIVEYYNNPTQRGYSTGWASVDEFYTIAPGEITIITGVPSHGKSEWLDALMIHLSESQKWRFAIFSPENQPFELHLEKLSGKITGKPFQSGQNERITLPEVARCVYHLDKFMWLIMPDEDTCNLDSILEKMRVCVHRHGVNGVVLDPWNEIDHQRPDKMSETEYISQSMTKMRRFARSNNVHFWLVAHPQKMRRLADGTYPIATPYDISGSAHWRNKADNCITVHRTTENNTVEIYYQKIRHRRTGHMGMSELIYDRVSGRYTSPGRPPMFISLPDPVNDPVLATEPEKEIQDDAVPF